MKGKDKGNNFVKQAGILAIAGIVVRIIGLLYKSPLYSVIGKTGNGYYSSAYNIYMIILLISSYSIPSAISKIMAQKMSGGEYKTAYRIFKCAVIYVTIVGLIASVVTYFIAPYFMDDENGIVVLQVFAPTIFFSGMLGVVRGYYQAHRTMVPTSISQVLEQIFNAFCSVGMAYLLINMADTKDETKKAVRGAMGSAIGTGVGVIVALIFMLCIFSSKKRKREEKENIANDFNEVETYGSVFKIILGTVTPFILSAFIYNVSSTMNLKIFTHFMYKWNKMEHVEITGLYGLYSNAYTIINIPVAMATAMATSVLPNIAISYSKGRKQETRNQIDKAVRILMLIAMPSAIALMLLSEPIVRCLYGAEGVEETSRMLMFISINVVMCTLSTLTNAVLQGMGKVNKPVTNAVLALIPQTIVLVLSIKFLDGENGVYGLVLAVIVYYILMCLLNGSDVKMHLGYKQKIKEMYIKPLIAAIVMGIVSRATYEGVDILMGKPNDRMSWIIEFVIAAVVAVITYAIAVLKCKVVDEEQLLGFPKGKTLVKVAKKFKLV